MIDSCAPAAALTLSARGAPEQAASHAPNVRTSAMGTVVGRKSVIAKFSLDDVSDGRRQIERSLFHA